MSKTWRERARTMLVVLLVLAAAAAVGWLWVVPALAKSKVRELVSDFWAGPIDVDLVDVALDGRVRVDRITLRDLAGRVWARLDDVEADLRDWPSLDPSAARIVVGGLDLRVHIVDGRILPPLRRLGRPGREKIVIRSTSVTIAPDNAPACRIRLRPRAQRTGDVLPFVARAGPTGDGGRRLVVPALEGGGFGGTVMVSGSAVIESDGRIDYQADVAAMGLDFDSLKRRILDHRIAVGGRLTARARITDRGGGLEGLTVHECEAFLDEVDLAPLPLAKQLFTEMGLAFDEKSTPSDITCKFRAAGPRVTVMAGRIANALSAVVVERGGSIDLCTGELDLYIVGVPMKQLRGVLDILSGPVMKLKDTITRVRLVGNWDLPAEQLVRKEPLRNLGAGTIGLFRDMAGTSGQFGSRILNTVTNGILHILEGGPPASGPAPPKPKHEGP